MTELSSVPIRSISVAIYGIGKFKVVQSVADLAGLLLSDQWPEETKGNSWRRALAECLSSLETLTGGPRARKAFVTAAREAKIAVMPDDASKPRRAPPRNRVPSRDPEGATRSPKASSP
jgi:hypothetical protein